MLRVPDKVDFSQEEELINDYWNKNETFRNSLKLSNNKKKFTFFDGPPFATGLPHYGHVLAGTIKDIVTRFAHQSGNYVGRRFGWDCHGLPVEFEIDTLLKITGPQDVEAMGIDKYNAECRKIVMRYSHDWEVIMGRLARWVDFEHDYKTLYPWYMESIWFIFRELYMKGLVYRGVKVMPFSTACNTPLSNFESGQNYKDVVDPQVTVGFPLVDDPNVQLVAWTTTPWTLPSNLTLCVHPELIYVRVKSRKKNELYILLESRLCMLFKKPEEYEVLEKFSGSKLLGLRYEPLFPYFNHLKSKGAFQVLTDKYVTDDAGTGIVQQAPYFGEDDYRVCLAAGVISRDQELICPVDVSGRFVEPVKDFLGLHVKVADKSIIQYLKKNSPHRLLDASTIKHSYPFCWRSDTPLIYRAIPSWFVHVEPLVDALLASSQATYWVPDFVKEKRFGNWLRNARDWAVSRNRYWGTPIPIWMSEDGVEVICVGSIAELEQLTGQKVTDLHRESIDHLTIPSARPNMPPLRRVSEVFDCWFESGSMPYAQLHFPFTRDIEITFHDGFPADFIGEGIDQTRGWFYTLLVISTALFNKAPYKNLIANGLVLAADGQKMSKRKKNYPDPMDVVKRYGADALRLYLINSPVVRAENLRFKEDGVRDVLKDVILPWYNAYRYLAQSLERLSTEEGHTLEFDENNTFTVTNIMDRWIKSVTQTMVSTVRKEMKRFHLYKVVPVLIDYIDQLTNWYIRMNRKRLKGDNGVKDCVEALSTLFEVLWTFVRLMAPFTPFICELMFNNLKRQLAPSSADSTVASVHFLTLPEAVSGDIDLVIERRIRNMQYVISTGRVIRDKRTVPVKYPLSELIAIHKNQEYLDDLKGVENYVIEELNIKNLVLSSDCEKYHVTLGAQVDHKILGGRLKGDFKSVLQAVQSFSDEQVQEFLEKGNIEVCGHLLTLDDVFISYRFAEGSFDQKRFETHGSQEVALMFNMERDAAMQDEGLAREVVNLVQKLRKKGQLVPTDQITVFYNVPAANVELTTVLSGHSSFIESLLRVPLRPASLREHSSSSVISEECQLKGTKAAINLEIVRGYMSDWAGPKFQTDTNSKTTQNETQQNERPKKKQTKKETDDAINNKVKNTVKEVVRNSPPCCMTPCIRYITLQPDGIQPKKDVFGGLIVPLENPAGNLTLVTGVQLKQIAAKHFDLQLADIILNAEGIDISGSKIAVPLNLSGKTIFLQSQLSQTSTSINQLPNQPFANVEFQGKKGIVFLANDAGANLSADEISQLASNTFSLKGKRISFSRDINGALNELFINVN